MAVNDSTIEVNKSKFIRPFKLMKIEKNSCIKMTDSIVESCEETAIRVYTKGQLELTRCQFIKGENVAIALYNTGTAVLKDCLFKNYSHGILTNSKKEPLSKLDVQNCRFEGNRMGIELRGLIEDFKFVNNKFIDNNCGGLITGLKTSSPLSLQDCLFKNNKSQALWVKDLRQKVQVKNCIMEGHGRQPDSARGSATILVKRANLELHGGRIEGNKGAALENIEGKIRVHSSTKMSKNGEPNKGIIQQD